MSTHRVLTFAIIFAVTSAAIVHAQSVSAAPPVVSGWTANSTGHAATTITATGLSGGTSGRTYTFAGSHTTTNGLVTDKAVSDIHITATSGSGSFTIIAGGIVVPPGGVAAVTFKANADLSNATAGPATVGGSGAVYTFGGGSVGEGGASTGLDVPSGD